MKRFLMILVALSMVIAGSKTTRTQRGAAVGAATGAALGVIIGKTAGNTSAGAVIGATVGGVAGAFIVKQMEKKPGKSCAKCLMTMNWPSITSLLIWAPK
ncbi:glycine zipper domain-containing protein [Lentimicrobium saccharophilum]|uniref:glycine zipper domain-containing protein n=1 Tax=Lentimicrobium saccharophilum TaxID=1678841 RepID=UPI0009E45A53|nr:glycine zipper domain-containing protein [Lentimicrobium saccharophilum]